MDFGETLLLEETVQVSRVQSLNLNEKHNAEPMSYIFNVWSVISYLRALLFSLLSLNNSFILFYHYNIVFWEELLSTALLYLWWINLKILENVALKYCKKMKHLYRYFLSNMFISMSDCSLLQSIINLIIILWVVSLQLTLFITVKVDWKLLT